MFSTPFRIYSVTPRRKYDRKNVLKLLLPITKIGRDRSVKVAVVVGSHKETRVPPTPRTRVINLWLITVSSLAVRDGRIRGGLGQWQYFRYVLNHRWIQRVAFSFGLQFLLLGRMWFARGGPVLPTPTNKGEGRLRGCVDAPPAPQTAGCPTGPKSPVCPREEPLRKSIKREK